MRIRLFIPTLFAGLLMAGHTPTEAKGDSPGIIGTWETVVDNQIAPPFDSLESFMPGGVAVISSDATPPPGQSLGTGHGTWKRVGKRRYLLVFKRFHFDSATGEFLFTLRVRSLIELSRRRDQSRGEFTFELILPDGTIIEPSPGGTTSGTRLKVD